MKIKSNILGIAILILIFGGILSTSLLNIWRTESKKVPRTFKEGQYEGNYDPNDIRGSYSFKDVSNAFDIPVDILKKAFHISDDVNAENFKNKDLEKYFEDYNIGEVEIGNKSVKLFVSLYTRLPLPIDEDIYLPNSAVEILKSTNKLTDTEIEYLNSHTVEINNVNKYKNEDDIEHVEKENTVTGQTTFKDLLDLGLSKQAIKEIIDSELPNLNMLVRDYCSNNGMKFSEIKAKLQEKVDEL